MAHTLHTDHVRPLHTRRARIQNLKRAGWQFGTHMRRSVGGYVIRLACHGAAPFHATEATEAPVSLAGRSDPPWAWAGKKKRRARYCRSGSIDRTRRIEDMHGPQRKRPTSGRPPATAAAAGQERKAKGKRLAQHCSDDVRTLAAELGAARPAIDRAAHGMLERAMHSAFAAKKENSLAVRAAYSGLRGCMNLYCTLANVCGSTITG